MQVRCPPPIATERLSLAPDGKVIYRLRRHWRGGTAAIAFDPLTFIERLAALVPRPRCHQLTYHSVLAPAAQLRDLVVPRGRAATPGTTPHPSVQRLPWAELLKRVFAIDALTCPWCGGSRKLIALLTNGLVVRHILAHLGLHTEQLPPPLPPTHLPRRPRARRAVPFGACLSRGRASRSLGGSPSKAATGSLGSAALTRRGTGLTSATSSCPKAEQPLRAPRLFPPSNACPGPSCSSVSSPSTRGVGA